VSRDGSLPSGCGGLDDLQQHVRVIGRSNKSLGIMALSEAMKIADGEHAELKKITQTTSPPIYRLVYPSEYQAHIEKRKRMR
jgi:translation initiation factor IF-3